MLDLSFLKSNRFWVMVIGAISIYLKARGIIAEPEMALIATISAGFVIVRTIDRVGESAGVEK